MARRARWWVSGATVAALAVALTTSAIHAKPGVVIDGNGTKYTGDVTASDDDKFVIVKGPGGEFRLARAFVQSIIYTASVDEQYEQRHAKLAADDAKGRVELGRWANDHSRADLAIKVLTEATLIEPTNRQAALDLDTAKRQLDLDRAGKKATSKPTTAAVASGDGRRQLTADEINLIREHEMTADDPKVKVKLENNVAKRYVAAASLDQATFDKLTPAGQALAILNLGDAKLSKDVRVLTDPSPILEFKTRVMPIIARGCGSVACHGGTNAGNFALYTGETPAATYSNFYVLQAYTAQVNGVKYNLLDRVTPERSLVLQFGLPANDGNPPHPKAADWRPRFKSKADPAYAEIVGWLTSFHPIAPDYGLTVSPYLNVAPTTVPTTGPTTTAVPPATKPAGK